MPATWQHCILILDCGQDREWDGVLVVAIAQNLSDTYAQYRTILEQLHSSEQFVTVWDRLNQNLLPVDGEIGIGPWDDGTMKLAVASVLGADEPQKVAVSNAIPWSPKAGSGSELLDDDMKAAAIRFSSDILTNLRPTKVLALGAKARDVMKPTANGRMPVIDMPGPFIRLYNQGYKMKPERLLQAFPEVARALSALRGRIRIANEDMAIHCACASVSRILRAT